MKNYWLLLVLALALGTTFGWAMNFAQYSRREAFFGEITTDGTVTALNVMDKLKEVSQRHDRFGGTAIRSHIRFRSDAPGTEGSHEFVVKNVGNDALKLTLGASTCKCTLGSLKNDQLAPGESTSVELEWTVSSDKSKFEQSAELRTNDPFQPAIRLTVRGLVISEIEFEPKQIRSAKLRRGKGLKFQQKCTVTSKVGSI